MCWDPEYSEQRAIILNRVITNKRMNREQFDLEKFSHAFSLEPMSWYYFRTEEEYHHLSMPDLGRSIKSFLVDSRYDNLFSMVTYSIRCRYKIAPVDLYGLFTLLIEQEPIRMRLNPLAGKILDFPVSTINIPEESRPFDHVSSIVKSISAVKINRWTTETKIILTDWDCGKSFGGDLNDPDFPVKSFIYLSKEASSYKSSVYNISESQNIVFSGLILDQDSKIRIIYPGCDIEHIPRSISIAFAGENVEAAVLSMNGSFETEDKDTLTKHMIEELTAFRHSLDFPTDDGRTIGFLLIGYDKYLRYSLLIYQITEIRLFCIRKIFPSTKFIDIWCSYSKEFDDLKSGPNGINSIRIHLVRMSPVLG